MNFIISYIIRKILVEKIIVNVDSAMSRLPQNEAKTITGILIAVAGLLIQALPEHSQYIQPVLDYLNTLPSEQIAAGGIAYMLVGLFHKAIKFISSRSQPVQSK